MSEKPVNVEHCAEGVAEISVLLPGFTNKEEHRDPRNIRDWQPREQWPELLLLPLQGTNKEMNTRPEGETELLQEISWTGVFTFTLKMLYFDEWLKDPFLKHFINISLVMFSFHFHTVFRQIILS